MKGCVVTFLSFAEVVQFGKMKALLVCLWVWWRFMFDVGKIIVVDLLMWLNLYFGYMHLPVAEPVVWLAQDKELCYCSSS